MSPFSQKSSWTLAALLGTLIPRSCGLIANPDVRHVTARQAVCSAPCGYWNSWYTQTCCGENQICITDALDQAKCGPRETLIVSIVGGTPTTVRTTIVQTSIIPEVSTATATASPESRKTSTTPTASASASADAVFPNSEEDKAGSDWPVGKIAGVAGGAGGATVLAAAVLLLLWRRNKRKNAHTDDDRDETGASTLAHVQSKKMSRDELNQMRENVADELAPPRYDNQGENPFSRAARRSRNPLMANANPDQAVPFNELSAYPASSDGRSEHNIPSRAVRGGNPGRDRNFEPRAAPRNGVRPDHDPLNR